MKIAVVSVTDCVRCALASGFPLLCCAACQPFCSTRFDAMVCSSTCGVRKHRGADLAYLADMPAAQADARRFVHQAHLDAVATTLSVAASRREGRAQRWGLPKVKPMKTTRARRKAAD
jgi:hypothetical protein